jgi:type IV pilus assembly protein PilB
MAKSAKRIGEILIEKRHITEAQLHDALVEQKIDHQFLGKILIKKGVISDKDLLEALSVQFGIPIVDMKDFQLDMELARKFSSALILDHKCFPIKQDDYTVTVAIVNPLDSIGLSKLEEESNPRKVVPVLAVDSDMEKAIQSYKQYINQSIQRLLKRPGVIGKPEE